jgi:SAM-dependent methyltransferase
LQELCAIGPLWNRGLTKPRGYPGDFEMLHSIYRNLPIAVDPVGRELDRAFLESPLAKTVRGRKKLLVNYLRQVISDSVTGDCRVLDLACGPSVDVAEILCGSRTDGSVHFVCVDQDSDAIAFSQSLLSTTLPTNSHVVDFLKANVLRLRACANSPIREPFTVVYSVGLLDYVPDNLASLALRNWWRMVAPGGRLVLTIKDRDRFDPTFYDWLADWTFIPRTEQDFFRLLKDSLGLCECQPESLREEMGISVMAIVRKR